MFDTVVPGVLARSTSAHPLRDFLARAREAFSAELSAHRAIAALGTLDARTLADIGVHPGEIESAVRHGRRAAPMEATRRATTTGATLPSSLTEWR